ncbi:ABC transporter permease [Thauera mechernichensis]|uniref:ABC transporter permease n=1 Tax=Thauera mechernichensis TaxID=82788 RepID=A0ABW3W7W3_9RHOO|nr:MULTISPECIES: ABC transporter permease subunit [Thauera]HNR59934.1 ABC transporter permease subunit [Thauera sp.]ENO92323.1 binding-protein-dependent transporter system inner membrane protein [Thauera sp. 28]MDG3063583.1 ABC transporter permease subunit [Thauera mechernichensis]WBL63556.1 ABC transporter permease subunit [Thauera sp. WB-2]HRJ22830.1 ABC transporter permease subunit [Thauera sp.]
MTLLRAWLAGLPAYLWSGWGAIASLFLLLAAWEAVSLVYGPLVMPDPRSAFATLWALIDSGAAWPELAATARRALSGYVLAVLAGSVLGLVAGLSMTASMMSRPLVTVLMGTPPIAWLVLAMLWFGASDGTPVFTVFVAAFPVIFIGALQGTRTLDNHLRGMAEAFRLPRRMMFVDVYLPHVVSYLFPAWIAALGTAWKVVVMAELLATQDGVGAALAVSRSHLDTASTMAWIAAVVGLLLAVEYLVLEPIKREVERWREQGT